MGGDVVAADGMIGSITAKVGSEKGVHEIRGAIMTKPGEGERMEVEEENGGYGASGKKSRGRDEEPQEGETKIRRMLDSNVRYSTDHTGEIFVLVDTSDSEVVKNKNGLYLIFKIKHLKSKEFEQIKKWIQLA